MLVDVRAGSVWGHIGILHQPFWQLECPCVHIINIPDENLKVNGFSSLIISCVVRIGRESLMLITEINV